MLSPMLFVSTDPLSSRQRFRARMMHNMIEIAILFVLLVGCASAFACLFFPAIPAAMVLIDIFALLGAYLLYTMWEKRPIKLHCPSCKKLILTNTPWVCGACGTTNRNTGNFPFVHQCENGNCQAEPRSYLCHHCGKLIFLSEDQDATNFAHSLNSPFNVTHKDKRQAKVRTYEERKQDLEHRIALTERGITATELRQRLKQVKGRSPKTKGSYRERKRASLKTRIEKHSSLEELGRELKAENAEKYKDDPDELERQNLKVDLAIQEEFADETANGDKE